MRARDFIYEDVPASQSVKNNEIPWQEIKTRCSDALEWIWSARQGNNPGFLYRGRKAVEDWTLAQSPLSRKSKDLGQELQTLVDNDLQQAGFKSLRSNSTFCTGDIKQAKLYGHPYMIFPVNGFEYTASLKVKDLYGDQVFFPEALANKPSVPTRWDYDQFLRDLVPLRKNLPPYLLLGFTHQNKVSHGLLLLLDYIEKNKIPGYEKFLAKYNLDNMIKPGDIVRSLGYGANLTMAIKQGTEVLIHGQYYLVDNKYNQYAEHLLFGSGL